MSDNHANFTPTLSGYSGQHPFRFWCQKVLPLVYDDSLSYYELLNKIVVYLNNVISDVSSVEGNIESMLAAYENLQYYVNHWFDTVDLTNECYVALNRMAENGELDTLIEPFVAERIDDVVAEQIGGAVSGQIDDAVAEQIVGAVSSQIDEPTANAVTTWLNANVDPVGGAVVVDSSLAITGAAADAKVTGENIRGISAGIARYETELGNDVFETTLFGIGAISGTTGEEIDSATLNARSIYLVNKYSFIKPSFDGSVYFYFYNNTSSSGYQGRSDKCAFSAGDIVPVIGSPLPFLRLMFVKRDVSAFSQGDIDAINENTKLINNSQADKKLNFAEESAKLLYNCRLEAGSIDGKYSITKGERITTTGNTQSNNKFARTSLVGIANKLRLSVSTSYAFYISYYDSSSSLQSSNFVASASPRCLGDYILNPPQEAKAFAVTFFATDHHVLTDDDVDAIRNSYMIYSVSRNRVEQKIESGKARGLFMAYMENACSKLGLSDSHFANASGFTRESYSTPRDELKIGIAVSGNPLALDIWSTKDRSFNIGGENAREISVTSGVYSGENNSNYKILGGKGGSLTAGSGDSYKRRARIALYDLNGLPIAISVMGKGDWTFDNIIPCMHDLVDMMGYQLSGNTPTATENIAHLLADGGGYAAIPVPTCAGAYLNSYSPADLLLRENALYSNESASQIPASTTKALTMLCALSIVHDLSEIITISSGDITSGSGSTFYAGDKLTVGDALRIMMMESSNTMAEAIGRYCGIKLGNTNFIMNN